MPVVSLTTSKLCSGLALTVVLGRLCEAVQTFGRSIQPRLRPVDSLVRLFEQALMNLELVADLQGQRVLPIDRIRQQRQPRVLI